MNTNDSTERVIDPTVYEPTHTWEQVYYVDSLRADEGVQRLNRRQEAWEGDPEEYSTLSMESVDGWIGDCSRG